MLCQSILPSGYGAGYTGQSDDSCPGWEWVRFHHTTENSAQFKTYKSFISGIFHAIFLGHGGPKVTETEKNKTINKGGLGSVQSLSRVQVFATLWTAARQASLSFTISWRLLKLMSIKSGMPSNHFIFCHSLLLLPSIFPSIRVFSNELVLCIQWPK